VTVSAAVFPNRKQNLMLARCCCSFKSAIAKSTKTITETQEKNHTVPIDLFPRTPLGQLMWRAVTYTHQAGADGTNTPHPSKKKTSRYFWVPPRKFCIPALRFRGPCLRNLRIMCVTVKRKTSILLWGATPMHIIVYGAALTATVEGRPWWNS
jgi:hypothetical protein